MGKKQIKKMLFITDRNILTTCGELRLIKNRAETLYSKWGIVTDFIVIASKNKINAKHEKIDLPCNMIAIPRTFNVLSVFNALKKEINRYATESTYEVIVVSGMFMEVLVPYLRKVLPAVKIIADIHGATEDILEVKKNASWMRGIALSGAYQIEKLILKRYLSEVDGIFVVSLALKDYLDSNYYTKDVQAFRVPCATTEEMMSEDEYEHHRRYYRDKYGLRDDEILFIYSGGISPWQCIGETLSIYKEISKQVANTKMLLISHNINALDQNEIRKYGILTDSYPPEEVEKVLCAGDYAFLLRKKCLTNKVAFPNKFLEYVRSGMRIIATPYVEDVTRQIVERSVGIIIEPDAEDMSVVRTILDDMENRKKIEIDDSDTRKSILSNNSFDKCLERFVESYFY